MKFKHSFRSFWVLSGLGFISIHLGLSSIALGAELHLRESLLQAQGNRVTVTVTAVVDHIGRRAHSLDEDCDLHVPLRSQDIRVPFIGELKNACSIKPAGTPLAFWSRQIYQETHGQAVPVTGVFRIWLEHPPPGNAVQTEAEPVPWYENSNPDHQVELHPLLQVGSLDFSGHVKWIEEGNDRFEGYGPGRLPTLLRKTLTIQRMQVEGESYIGIRGTKTPFNHWDLRGIVTQPPQPLADGLVLRLDILEGNHIVPGALTVPAVAAAGTAAHNKAQNLNAGDVIQFQALVRIHLPTILDQLGDQPLEIQLPLEFVLLDLE